MLHAKLGIMSKKIENQRVIPAQPGAMPSWYGDLLGEVKDAVGQARSRVQRAVNTELIQMYWEIGHRILARQDAGGWGTKVVERLSADLKSAFPHQRGFSRSNLIYMHRMARTWPEPIVQQPVGQLPWGHITVLMSKLSTRAELDFYTANAVQHGWSRGMLEHWIASRLHFTQGAAATNFTATIPDGADVLQDIVKDPYRLDFLGLDTARDPERDDATIGILIGTHQNADTSRIALDGNSRPLAVSTYATLRRRRGR
ncbi:DUF1016 N-terminal domain-containing protein [Streptomyces sp. H10-C2]|uniref:DUF1016 N-terminal domain-containing protein n=1 Tax=unclassified Streptomyces TaxID=2593676 RepID=UPI0024BB029D|nr:MULTISPECIES: DUF1016 N-terminal domain-containing protein [unclassified Streptomyces]MDJ0345328.1 DUF1016 N-terminal domain-containing protein [Streptomyces sp. PH10-H1]MDJ0374233.1 DUF1016 N-terminal domain-containing protein [Streptomyces sp. H10-C2]